VSGPPTHSFHSLLSRVRPRFDAGAVSRGDTYAREGRVTVRERTPGEVTARVMGTTAYSVILLGKPPAAPGELLVDCSCAAFERDLCKHVWAVLAATDREQLFPELARSPRPVRVSRLSGDLDEGPREDELATLAVRGALAPRRAPTRPRVAPPHASWRRALMTATARPWERPRPPEALDRRHKMELGYVLDLLASQVRGDGLHLLVRERAAGHVTKPGPWKAAQLTARDLARLEDPHDAALLRSARPPPSQYDWQYPGSYALASAVVLQDRDLWERYLRPLAQTGRCAVQVDGMQPPVPLEIDRRGAYRLVLVVREERSRLTLHGELRRGALTLPLTDLAIVLEHGVAFHGARALQVESDAAFGWVQALRHERRLVVPAEDTEDFLRGLLATCGMASLDLPPAFRLDDATPAMITRVQLHTRDVDWSMQAGPLLATITFDYGGVHVGWRDAGEVACAFEERRLFRRDLPGERAALEQLAAVGFRLRGARGDEGTVELAASRLVEAVATLPSDRFVVLADGVRQRTVTRTAFRVGSGIDWFELDAVVEFDGVAVPLPEVLAAAHAAKTTVLLGDGSQGILPPEWLARLKRVASMSQGGDALRFTRAQLGLIEAMLADDREPVVWDASLDALRQQLATSADLPGAKTPRTFKGKLRPYQAQGVAWLAWLESIGISGCLADDMGLGKTVQVLAHLVSRKARGEQRGPSLVVAPRSVVYNWLDEAQRFAPSLRIAELSPDIDLEPLDVVVTTYGVLRQEVGRLTRTTFDYAILDEAHAIKNPLAATTKAARLLRAHHRLALTGTPVENHLGELASLFDFLNPGMLGHHARRGLTKLDAEDAQRLGRGLKPFLLRRTKTEVLADLPARVEQTLHCEMTKPQRIAYDRVRKHYQDVLLGRLRKEGMAGSTMHVLEALLRLRQLACHSALVDPTRKTDGSGKLDVLMEQLVPLAEQGKKALVFSQFTSFLDLVELELMERGIAFERLDGSTKDRKARVTRFQEDAGCSIFLISLKAGGLGLNLTAAEYVFLLDPWWNPAAEAQAIDRAHRIGQTRTVVAYRMLATDSIEHRVAELQARKRAVVAAVFDDAGGAPLAGLSIADVEMLLT
jgi:superfamily II DNA or RNA helicase